MKRLQAEATCEHSSPPLHVAQHGFQLMKHVIVYESLKQAEAIEATAKAYGSLAQVMGGPQGLLQYLMLQDHTYEKLARANAQAIQGLNPKITVWNTGTGLLPFSPLIHLPSS